MTRAVYKYCEIQNEQCLLRFFSILGLGGSINSNCPFSRLPPPASESQILGNEQLDGEMTASL